LTVAKDYYLVLGISPNADQRQIKRAYRRAAKRLHPDTGSHGQDTRLFQEAREAYEVLSDAARRGAYDAAQAHGEAETARRARPRAPYSASSAWDNIQVAAMRAERLKRSVSPTAGLPIISLEVRISSQEAQDGGCFEVRLPFPAPCALCGERRDQPWGCPMCRGRLHFWSTRIFELELPPGIQDQTSVQLPLAIHGMAWLTLHVRVHVAVPRR
jgi:molecular chaperone DnaJ